MTPNELRAYIDGMDIQDAPTPEQWAMIKDKLEALNDTVYLPQPLAVPTQPWPDLGPVITCSGDTVGTGIQKRSILDGHRCHPRQIDK